MMDLQQLIERGEDLKRQSYRSPLYDVWKNDVRDAVAAYGEPTMRVLEKAWRVSQIARSAAETQSNHPAKISRVQELLTELQKRNPSDMAAQSLLMNQKMQEARATLRAKFGNTTFNGPVTFGDNSPANSFQVGELIMAIISEAEEKLPDGPEKNKILASLKEVVTNPTFAAIAGASLPEVIKRLFGTN